MTSPLVALGRALSERSSTQNPKDVEPLRIRSTPQSVVWGHIPPQRTPVATISVETPFVIDTVSHRGLVEGTDPVSFFRSHGIAECDVLDDVQQIYSRVERPNGANSHILTGPVYFPGAQSGDALEVFIHATELRVGYGVNAARPGQGLLPNLLTEPSVRVLRTNAAGTRVAVSPGVSAPVAPFPGFIATAPAASDGMVGTRVPGRWGGNLDLRLLVAGSSIVLPVARPGALLYVGDPHAAQGHGEVNGTALEQSASFVLEARLYHGLAPTAPVVLTPESIVCLGINRSPRKALKQALGNTINFLLGWSHGVIDVPTAYALCSIAADAGVAEVVNGADVAYVSVPRDVFTEVAR